MARAYLMNCPEPTYILDPHRYVQQLLKKEGVIFGEVPMQHLRHGRRLAKDRRQTCGDCILGSHETCWGEACGCIHRLDS
jgi:hypothetical protein